jgi:hypothetical protein
MPLAHYLRILCQELVRVEETGLVLLARVILLRCLLPHLLHRLLHCLLHRHFLLRGVWEVVVVVGGMVVSLYFQGSGIANEECLCFVVHLVGLRGPSLVLGECFRRCLRLHSLRVL